MKNYIVAILILLFFSKETIAQSIYPKGIYLTLEELVNKKPSDVSSDFTLKKRNERTIYAEGGNDYKIESENLSGTYFKKNVFAVSTGDTVYINCKKLGEESWYAKVICEGSILFIWVH